ncbi:MAG: NAD-dependent epimerase/dehydratase family protein [Candidatus Nanopelagicales bacterium]
MRLLILGGTRFAGPAVAAEAVARGWDVTVAHRGRSGPTPAGARHVAVDRTRPADLERLADGSYDLVVDTWSGAPAVARATAAVLAPVTGRWAYVSSRSVYAPPPARGADESAPLVDADPDAGQTDYPADKRGAELALERELGADRVVSLRCGLVLGPGEDVGRLPWWLRRVARGGDVLAPAPPDLGVQYVDVRDLARFACDVLADGRSGPVDVVRPAGDVTLGDVLGACVRVTGGRARLVWVDPHRLVAAGVAPWTDLPLWIPWNDPWYGLLDSDESRARSWGLRSRPADDTVAATWDWVRRVDADGSAPPPRSPVGLDPDREARLLADLAPR